MFTVFSYARTMRIWMLFQTKNSRFEIYNKKLSVFMQAGVDGEII